MAAPGSNAAGKPLSVIVAGAGSAGLLIAHTFKKAGITCTVYEQDATIDMRPRDWNFGVYWAQSPLKDCLPEEIVAELTEIQVDDHVPSPDDILPVFHGVTGEKLIDIPAPFSLRLQRKRFIQLISQGINVQYGKRLQNIALKGEDLVTAHFEDGTEATADLLIGAEGAHSRVREYLLGAEKAALDPSPVVASIVLTTIDNEAVQAFLKLHHRCSICFHPNGYFLWWGLHDAKGKDDPADWIFMVGLTYMQEEAVHLNGVDIISDMKERSMQFGEPFKTLVAAIPEDSPAWHKRLSYWTPQPWDSRNGRITLVGDAAHPMTFHRGQGLNNAISDVYSFLTILQSYRPRSQDDLAVVVSAYEAELLPRGKSAVEMSNVNTLVIHHWEKLIHSPLFTAGLSKRVN